MPRLYLRHLLWDRSGCLPGIPELLWALKTLVKEQPKLVLPSGILTPQVLTKKTLCHAKAATQFHICNCDPSFALDKLALRVALRVALRSSALRGVFKVMRLPVHSLCMHLKQRLPAAESMGGR